MKITYVLPTGEQRIVDAQAGDSVMRAAVDAAVPGIIGECGGQAMCATCHVFVGDVAPGPLPPASADEVDMLECTAVEHDPDRSRLGCQLIAGEGFTELTVSVPERQV